MPRDLHPYTSNVFLILRKPYSCLNSNTFQSHSCIISLSPKPRNNGRLKFINSAWVEQPKHQMQAWYIICLPPLTIHFNNDSRKWYSGSVAIVVEINVHFFNLKFEERAQNVQYSIWSFTMFLLRQTQNAFFQIPLRVWIHWIPTKLLSILAFPIIQRIHFLLSHPVGHRKSFIVVRLLWSQLCLWYSGHNKHPLIFTWTLMLEHL